ncbi:uncharacterized protein F4822DRAFT_426120 [Hypoxylon trugodes]|uniref:uncharacterized protein n=1 Tax=Hypoxylon trugodes TaxID=326681 RepID=UPI00219ABE0A|nr:uncharacterized protein F4822DRAFT_426120 [Hypoxylon trugodes]KAI1392919.1 hypothetical protein F4822DRAFT_426120 [Hypoxylon trugodes]
MAGQKIIKYSLEHFRKDGISEEAFLKWFQEYHLPYGVPLMKKHGVVKYAVHTRVPPLCDAFQDIIEKIRPGWEVSKADLVLEYWMPDLSCLNSLIEDPDWNGKAVKGQEDWLDMSRSTIHIGYETTYLEDGNVVNL